MKVLVLEIEEAFCKDRALREATRRRMILAQRLDSLTGREYEVLRLVVAGRLNKQIATTLGITENTIKVHRARMMDKMGWRSLADVFSFMSEADPFLLASMRREVRREVSLA